MRVALFCPDYPPSGRQGGIQDYSQHLVKALTGQGLDVTVITGEGYSGKGKDGLATIVKFPEPWDKRWALRVVEELEERSVELVNLQYSPAMFENPHQLGWSVLAARFPSVVSFHTLWGGSRWNVPAAVRLLHSAHQVIATNSEILHLMRRYLPWTLSKTAFVPIGSNIIPHEQEDVHKEVIGRYNIRRDRLLLVYFGMAYPGKGLDLLLGAASRLENAQGLNFQLLCVGGGVSDVNTYQSEGQRKVSELGLEKQVTWTGRIPASHVSSLLTVSDMVVLPYEAGASDRRGSLLAALAHGKPIVTTRPRIRIPHFSNGKNMIWPETTSPESLSRTITRLYGDRSLQETLGKGALELASKLQWGEIAEDTKLLFEKLRDAAAN